MSEKRTPSVSFIMVCFNQRQTIDAAIESAFSQDHDNLEIVLSDDASSDGTWERIQELTQEYRGPHQVIARRNEKNLGIGKHFNAAIAQSQGELIVAAAGDDISLAHRVRSLETVWRARDCKPDLITSHVFDMKLDGTVVGKKRVDDLSAWRSGHDWMKKPPLVIGAAHAFTRRLLQHFGPFDDSLTEEDQVCAFRAICLGGGVTVDEALVKYRQGGVSTSVVSQAALRLLRKHKHRFFTSQQVLLDAKKGGLGSKAPYRFARRHETSARFLQALGVSTEGFVSHGWLYRVLAGFSARKDLRQLQANDLSALTTRS